jgi:hypothetical protein
MAATFLQLEDKRNRKQEIGNKKQETRKGNNKSKNQRLKNQKSHDTVLDESDATLIGG